MYKKEPKQLFLRSIFYSVRFYKDEIKTNHWENMFLGKIHRDSRIGDRNPFEKIRDGHLFFVAEKQFGLKHLGILL